MSECRALARRRSTTCPDRSIDCSAAQSAAAVFVRATADGGCLAVDEASSVRRVIATRLHAVRRFRAQLVVVVADRRSSERSRVGITIAYVGVQRERAHICARLLRPRRRSGRSPGRRNDEATTRAAPRLALTCARTPRRRRCTRAAPLVARCARFSTLLVVVVVALHVIVVGSRCAIRRIDVDQLKTRVLVKSCRRALVRLGKSRRSSNRLQISSISDRMKVSIRMMMMMMVAINWQVFTVGLDQKAPPSPVDKSDSPPPGYPSTVAMPLPMGPEVAHPIIVRKSRGYKGILLVMLGVFLMAVFARKSF